MGDRSKDHCIYCWMQVESVAKTLDLWDSKVSWKHNCQEEINELGMSNGHNPLLQGIVNSFPLQSQDESQSAFALIVSNAAAWGVSQPSSRLSFDCKALCKEVPVPKISKVLRDNAAEDCTCHCMPQSWQCCVATCFCLHNHWWSS